MRVWKASSAAGIHQKGTSEEVRAVRGSRHKAVVVDETMIEVGEP